jgi:hypothetical protein
MSVRRLLAVIIVPALLGGCDVGDDIRALKADIAALRTLVMALPLTNKCGEIGVETSKVCTYQLKVTDDTDKANHLYIGIIDPGLYKQDPEVCKKGSQMKRRKGFENLPWDCDEIYPDPDSATEYAFHVDNDTDIKKGGTYQFRNVAYKTHLKKIRECPC